MYRLGIDTGGTNTDVVLTNIETGRMYYAKTPTTPKALMDGIMNGIKIELFSQSRQFLFTGAGTMLSIYTHGKVFLGAVGENLT